MLLYLKKTSLPSSYTDSSRDSTATNHTCSYKHWDHWYKFKQSFFMLNLPTAIYIVACMAFTTRTAPLHNTFNCSH